MDTYRGYNVIQENDGFYWIGDDNQRHGPHASDEKAFDDIDAYRKRLRAQQEAA